MIYDILSSHLRGSTNREGVHIIDRNISREKKICIIRVFIHDSHLTNIATNAVFIEIPKERELRVDIILHRMM